VYLEVFDSREIVSWCVDKFDQNRRMIQLQGESLISLSPSVFKRMLKLLEPTITFKGDEARSFLKEKYSGLELLQEYLEDPTTMPQDISNIQVSSLKNPYREIAWIFSRVSGQYSTTTIPRLALYILHFIGHEQVIFDWEDHIWRNFFSIIKFQEKKEILYVLIFDICYYLLSCL
jgi:hypothetical protein